MKLFLILNLAAFGLVATAASDVPEDIILRGQSIDRKRTFKGGDSAKSSCPSPTIYLPPDNCDSACYKDIGVMIDDINQGIAEGTPFIATICSGTHHYPTDKYVNGYTAVSEVIVRCCGLQNSCIIDGGGPDQRSTPFFYFVSTVRHLVVEGIKFQNINCNGDDLDWYRCSGSLIHTKGVAVISLRHLTVDSAVTNRMGGAFYMSEGDVTIEGCTFTNNHAELTGGVIRADASMTLYGNTFHGNSANSGGAMEVAKSADVICNTFENNSAQNWGGAIYSELGKIRLSYNMYLGNKASNGGAVYNGRQDIVSLANKYTNNSATNLFGSETNGGQGGAIYGDHISIKSAVDTFISNSALVG